FLDIAMPGMDGFELCTRLRALPTNQQTPVVFLTGVADFENRAQSILRGGNDLMAKPFLPAELIVKALTHIYKSQLQGAEKK
ncbi:MAG: response regulator, partial [Limisphaerales bacterium]